YIEITITDEGRESSNYILAQKTKIEEVLSKISKHKIVVSMTNPVLSLRTSAQSSASFEEVEGNELVQIARGLFDGTVVQVTNSKKGNT
ncbi:MAG: hypothetical protein P8N28_00340, partial [Phycisphaerales bacterium]|nr:hypothetical protein [Phycisphaerales bacterium]